MIELSTKGLELRDVVAVARQDAEAVLTDEARRTMADGAAIVQRLADSEEPVYGVSTGFGSLATTPIPPSVALSFSEPCFGLTPRAWDRRSSARSCGR